MLSTRPNRGRAGAQLITAILLAATPVLAQTQPAQPLQSPNPAAVLRDLKKFAQTGRVLYVAAHPDDENTQLITYFAKGRLYQTAYLSLTRGDGGQNVIGPEFGSELGLIRTHELLAARKIDGAEQFFTRAQDFGYSKSADETMRFWNRKEVLGDIVRVYRTFRPDVVVTRFNPDTGGTHGHHTASAILAREAFKLAGDPTAYPEQLQQGLTPWQPKRIFMNGRGGDGLQIDTAGKDPVTGETFGLIAAKSRGQHKSQGFGFNPGGGRGGDEGPRPESFTLLVGDPAEKDPFDNIDTTFARFENGEAIAKQVNDIIAAFNAADLEATAKSLLELRKTLTALPQNPLLPEKLKQLDQLIADALGITVTTTTDQTELCPGESITVKQTITNPSSLRIPFSQPDGTTDELFAGKSFTRTVRLQVPPDDEPSQPYWLREEGSDGLSKVGDPKLIGLSINPPVAPATPVLQILGQSIKLYDQVRNSAGRPLEIVGKVSLHPTTEVELFAPGSTRTVEVEVFAARPVANGRLTLHAPDNWKVEPSMQNFTFESPGQKTTLSFKVTAPANPENARLSFEAMVGINTTVSTSRHPITYPHIPPLLVQPKAEIKATILNVTTAAKNVAYIPGAGDDTIAALRQLGCNVTTLKPEDLKPDTLKAFDAIVLGVRALNIRGDLSAAMPALIDYAKAGGTLLVQYNRPNDLKASLPEPYTLRPTNNRVTDETAAPTFLAPDHKAFNSPNKITQADFDNWTQERGIYFPSNWSNDYTPLLAFADPGEQPQNGSLLIAPVEKGNIVYTSLVFFRQLPAANPGAYRLFANLLSLSK